ncbi:MAG: hypothetical protein IKX00_04735 [Bacilli bacterium]|nr:hypothetical protein [Bacilli bacterium]
MDSGVKQAIDARHDAFKNAYELNNEFNDEIETLFKKIYDFGNTCSDAMDFENKFMSSPLNEEYNNLFIKIGSKCPLKKYETTEVEEESKASKVFNEAASDAKYIADEVSMPARRQARMQMESKLRDTPLGKVEQASNMFHLFKKFKKPKKTDENIEE